MENGAGQAGQNSQEEGIVTTSGPPSTTSTTLTDAQKFVESSVGVASVVATRVVNGAMIVGRTPPARFTAAASLEAARFTMERACKMVQRMTDKNFNAFWEPRNDKFSSISWWARLALMSVSVPH